MLSCDQLSSMSNFLNAGDLLVAKNGAKNAPVGLGAELKTLRLVLSKIPILRTPFEPSAFDGGDRVSFDIRVTPIEAAIDKLDEAILVCVKRIRTGSSKSHPAIASFPRGLAGPNL